MKEYQIVGPSGPFAVYVHSSPEARMVVVNVPGYNGTIDGYNGKYAAIGRHLAVNSVAAFVQMPNITRSAEVGGYCRGLNADIEAVCAFVRARGSELCDAARPKLCLVGFSAGGAGCAAVAASTRADRVLLMEPSRRLSVWQDVWKSLRAFEGRLYVVTGSGEHAVGEKVGRWFYDIAREQSRAGFYAIPACDHQFRGTRNGQIMAKAYEWVLRGDTSFPSSEGGLILY